MVPANRGVDVIEFAIRDLEYAAVNLSKTASDVGRVTCYSAYAILSRMYLSMAGLTTEGEYNGSNIATDFNRGSRNTYYLDMARKAATKVIEEGPYSLLDNYGTSSHQAHATTTVKPSSSCSGCRVARMPSVGDAIIPYQPILAGLLW